MQDFQTHSELRILGSIRSSANAYKTACKDFFFKSKLLAVFYINCVNRPLVDLPDDVKVIEILSPMELHLLSGNTNRIYNNLEKCLQPMGFTLSANQWNQSLGFQSSKLHDCQFKGGECSKLLKNIHVLEELIKSSKLARDEHISSIVNSFSYLISVKAACQRSRLLPEHELTINEYKKANVKLALRVSSKVHALLKHACKFLSFMSSSNSNKGLNF